VNARLAAAAALTLPLTALAADWVKVPVPDVNQHGYDRSKVLVEGDGVTYWRRVEFRAPQRAKAGVAGSAMYRERIDCRTHSHRTLGYLLYAQDGTVIEWLEARLRILREQLEHQPKPQAAPEPAVAPGTTMR
jgi:hypothetical protein